MTSLNGVEATALASGSRCRPTSEHAAASQIPSFSRLVTEAFHRGSLASDS
jgi:hypothetical protein